jgi:hypothetical protein
LPSEEQAMLGGQSNRYSLVGRILSMTLHVSSLLVIPPVA